MKLKIKESQPVDFEPAELTQEFINGLCKKTLFNKFETKAKGNRGIIKGFASTYDVDEGGDMIRPGAFSEDLDKFAINPVMLFSHQLNLILGTWKSFEEQAGGLYVEGEINLKTQLGKDTYALISDGDLKGMSIGYSILERDNEKEIQLLKRLRLWEISTVAIPMNQSAWITGTKIFNGIDIKEMGDKEIILKGNKVDMKKVDKMLPYENWNNTAASMCKLLTGRVNLDMESKKYIFDILKSQYSKFAKIMPLIKLGEEKVEPFDALGVDINIKDIEWQEDEKFILECSNLNGSLQASINIIKYFLKTDRIKSVSLDRIKEVQDLLEEINPKGVTNIPDDKILIDETELDEFLAVCKTLKDRIINVKKFNINEIVIDEFKKALAEATGKEIK